MHLATFEFANTGGAHALPAAVGKVDAMLKRRLQYSFALTHLKAQAAG